MSGINQRLDEEMSVLSVRGDGRVPSPVEQGKSHGDTERGAWEFLQRHVQMMAIGVSIGTGLLVESGNYLQLGGSVTLWLSFLMMGSVVAAVMLTLGEMISFLPIPGAVFSLANRALSPAIGFASGWIYCYGYAVDYPNKAIAAAKFMGFWTDINPAVWITIFLIIPLAFNFFNVRRYGEIEFWLTAIKVTTIVGLIILGFLLAMGASVNPQLGTNLQGQPVPCAQDMLGGCVPPPGFGIWRQSAFQTYVTDGAAGRLAAIWKCCSLAIFSYTGVENVGITADETEKQRKTLPRAVKRITKRIIFYYVGAALVLGLNLSPNDPTLSPTSPNYPGGFIIMAQRAGIPVLPHIINAVMIIAALSVANANLYVVSRSLYALANEQHSFIQAPRFLTIKNRWEVPYVALLVGSLMGPLAYMDLRVSSANIFSFLSTMTSTAILIPWAVICATYLRLRKGVDKRGLKGAVVEESKSRLQPYLAWYGLVWCTVLVIFQGFEVFTRFNKIWSAPGMYWGFTLAPFAIIAGFLGLILFAVALSGWTLGIPSYNRMDLNDGQAAILSDEEPSKRPWWRRYGQKVLEFI